MHCMDIFTLNSTLFHGLTEIKCICTCIEKAFYIYIWEDLVILQNANPWTKLTLNSYDMTIQTNLISSNPATLVLSKNIPVVEMPIPIFFFFINQPLFMSGLFFLPVWERKENHWVWLYLQASQAGLDHLNRGPLWRNSTQPVVPFHCCAFVPKNWETLYDSLLMTSNTFNPPTFPPHIEFFFYLYAHLTLLLSSLSYMLLYRYF